MVKLNVSGDQDPQDMFAAAMNMIDYRSAIAETLKARYSRVEGHAMVAEYFNSSAEKLSQALGQLAYNLDNYGTDSTRSFVEIDIGFARLHHIGLTEEMKGFRKSLFDGIKSFFDVERLTWTRKILPEGGISNLISTGVERFGLNVKSGIFTPEQEGELMRVLKHALCLHNCEEGWPMKGYHVGTDSVIYPILKELSAKMPDSTVSYRAIDRY